MADDRPLDGVLQTRLAKALSHPLRHRLLIKYGERVASPRELAEELHEPLNTVSYHTQRLLSHGLLEPVRTERRRGAVKHYYRTAVVLELEDDRWRSLSKTARQSNIGVVLATIWADLAAAGAARTLEADDVHVSRLPLDLDEQGWRELSTILRAVVEDARRLEVEAHERRAHAPGPDDGRPSTLALLHFELPPRA